LTEDQIAERNRNDHKQYFCTSGYEDKRGDLLKAVLHLHPPLIEINPDGCEPKVIICNQCLIYMQKKKHQKELKKPRSADTEKNEQRFMNQTLCIAEGYDFGNLLGCPELSLLEKTLPSQYVFYGTLIKLVAWRGVISLRSKATSSRLEQLLSMQSTEPPLLFPWFDVDEILACIKVSFVGPGCLH
jgi:hypothetical protein